MATLNSPFPPSLQQSPTCSYSKFAEIAMLLQRILECEFLSTLITFELLDPCMLDHVTTERGAGHESFTTALALVPILGLV